MVQQQSNNSEVNLFKKVYGDIHQLTDDSQPFGKAIPFSAVAKVGASFEEAFAVTNATGWTIAGQNDDAFAINPARSAVVKQSTIKPSQVVLSSVIPWGTMSRGSGGGEKAFYDSTKWIMKTHLESHGNLLETLRIHGQSPKLLGYVSYAAVGVVYRKAVYNTTPGTITLSKADGTTITFTNGINVANKAVLMAPGNYASGIWVGNEGARVLGVDDVNGVLFAGDLVGTDSDLGIVYLSVTPTAPTAASGSGSVRLCFEGMEAQLDMVGIERILRNTGSLFGISAAQYSLWRANRLNLAQKRLNLKAIQLGVAQAVNAGGLKEAIDVWVNPRSQATMITDEAAMRKYDAKYNPSAASNGFGTIEFHGPNGLIRVRAHSKIHEGVAFGLVMSSWLRSGSAEVSFKIPGAPQDVIFPLENQAGWMVRTYSDEYIMCRRPAVQILFDNINDEGAPF